MNKTLHKERFCERTFETQDIQLAASIFALGDILIAIDRRDPSRCTFVFKHSDNVMQIAAAYWQRQLSIEPQALLGALKALKSRLYGEKT